MPSILLVKLNFHIFQITRGTLNLETYNLIEFVIGHNCFSLSSNEWFLILSRQQTTGTLSTILLSHGYLSNLSKSFEIVNKVKVICVVYIFCLMVYVKQYPIIRHKNNGMSVYITINQSTATLSLTLYPLHQVCRISTINILYNIWF